MIVQAIAFFNSYFSRETFFPFFPVHFPSSTAWFEDAYPSGAWRCVYTLLSMILFYGYYLERYRTT